MFTKFSSGYQGGQYKEDKPCRILGLAVSLVKVDRRFRHAYYVHHEDDDG
jgi:hypothetical protein